ncbi:MAG: hypothetical protein HC875_24075, partial [Anaerolineales bacterium]|nr:hypothetical protein [Anaerolineales bacterium]
FNPDERIPVLVSGSEDEAVISWDVADVSWQKRACRIAGRNLTSSELSQYIPAQFQAATQAEATCPEYPYPYPQPKPALSPAGLALNPPTLLPSISSDVTPAPTATATATPFFPVPPVTTSPTPAYVRPLLLTSGSTRFWAGGLASQGINLATEEVTVKLPAGESILQLWLLTTKVEVPPLVGGVPATLLTGEQEDATVWAANLIPARATTEEIIIRVAPPNRLQSLFLSTLAVPPDASESEVTENSGPTRMIYLPLVMK